MQHEISHFSARQIPFRLDLTWTLFGNGTFAVCQWLVVAGLARIRGPELVGQFALVQAVVLPVIVLANLQLRTVVTSDASNRFAFADYFGLRVVMLAGAGVAIGGASLIYRADPATLLALLATGLYRGLESLSDICCGLQQQAQRMDRVAISTIGRGTLATLAILALILAGQPLWIGILGMAVMAAAVFFGYDVPQARHELALARGAVLRPRFAGRRMAELGRTVAPMAVVAVSAALLANIPRYWIDHLVGRYELGIFAALMSVLAALHLVQTSLGQAALPRLARHYVAGRKQPYRRLAWALVAGAIGSAGFVVATAAVCGKPLVTLVYSAQFASYSAYFVLLSVVSALHCLVGVTALLLHSMQRFREAAVGHVLACLVTAMLAPWLVARYGLWGAALAMACGLLAALGWLCARLASGGTWPGWAGPAGTRTLGRAWAIRATALCPPAAAGAGTVLRTGSKRPATVPHFVISKDDRRCN